MRKRSTHEWLQRGKKIMLQFWRQMRFFIFLVTLANIMKFPFFREKIFFPYKFNWILIHEVHDKRHSTSRKRRNFCFITQCVNPWSDFDIWKFTPDESSCWELKWLFSEGYLLLKWQNWGHENCELYLS